MRWVHLRRLDSHGVMNNIAQVKCEMVNSGHTYSDLPIWRGDHYRIREVRETTMQEEMEET